MFSCSEKTTVPNGAARTRRTGGDVEIRATSPLRKQAKLARDGTVAEEVKP